MWGGTAAAAGPPEEGTELEPPPGWERLLCFGSSSVTIHGFSNREKLHPRVSAARNTPATISPCLLGFFSSWLYMVSIKWSTARR